MRLVVSDGSLTSAPDTVDVTARAANTAPAVNAQGGPAGDGDERDLEQDSHGRRVACGGFDGGVDGRGGGVTLPTRRAQGRRFQFSTGGVYTPAATATDGALTARDETVVTADLTAVHPARPPDPVTVAPPIDPTVATDLAQTTAFLYRGANPIQTGVSSTTFRPEHAAVVQVVC
ncbi:MAG: hypothetical protein IPL30_10105 [Elusimicrobia bacterium]|nr:hypothetical protein [Elusimicrobiota bacterium]